MLKPKVGDLVRLKPVCVRDIDNDFKTVKFIIDNETGWSPISHIEEILPHPLAVGDRVRFITPVSNARSAVVLAFNGAWAWLFIKDVGYETVETKELTRIDEP